ncbi:MAG: MFS transporter [Lentisphaeria bacterium]|nr:MFS transporter [Lentisphaeria bacterium]
MTQDHTRYWKRNLILMWIVQLSVMIGFDSSMPFVPQLLRENFHMADQAQRGVCVSIFAAAGFLAYAIFCPIWGTLSDRFGVKIMLLRGFFVTCFFYPLMGYISEPWMLIALRFITAACGGTTAASNILLVKTVPENRIGFALGFFGTATWGGSMLGQFLGGIVVDQYGYKTAFWGCGILYFLAGICTLFTKDAPRNPAPAAPLSTNAAKIHRYRKGVLPGFTYGVWAMMLVMMFYTFVRRFEIPYVSMLIELITGPEKAVFWTGMIGAFTGIGAVLSGIVIGYLSDRCKPQVIIAPSLAAAAILLFVNAYTNDLVVLALSRMLLFFCAGSLYPVLQKLLSGATPQRKRGKVFGWSTTFNNVGGMLATTFSGWVIFLFETRGVFVAAAILTAILIPVTLWGTKVITNQPFYIAHAGKDK